MSFKSYKFCQNGVITVFSSVFAMFYSLSISGNLSWWLGLLIGIGATIVAFIPPIGLIYPLTFGIFILIALVRAYLYTSGFFWLLLAILILHVVRFVAMFIFCRTDPQKSLEYDTAIRYGYKFE